MKEVIAKVVREEMYRQRPPARYGKVYDFNRFTLTCDVLFPGDTEPTRVKMPLNMQPVRRIVADGDLFVDVARVEGTPGNMWVTEFVNGQVFQDSPIFHRPELRGGSFMHQSVAKHFGGSSGPLPAEGEVWFLGRWRNDASFGSDGLAVLDIVIRQSFFCSVTKHYKIAIRSNDSQDTWVKCAPIQDSGPWSGNDFELEMKAGEAQLEFRIRRTGWNTGGFTPGGYNFDIWFYGENWEQEAVDTHTIAAAIPGKMSGTHSVEGKGPFLSPAYAAPIHAQHTLTGGGAVTYITSLGILKWSERFIVMGLGRSYLAESGYFDIPVPLGGVQIPVYTKDGSFTTETVAGGIWFNGWDALYYELPWGGWNNTGTEANFRIVSYSGTGSFQVPSHWILIAQRNTEDGFATIRLGTGETIADANLLSLNANWVALGGGWASPQWRPVQGNMVTLEGLVKTTVARASGSSHVIANIPEAFRPGVPHMYTVKTTTGFGRVDVAINGDVRLEQTALTVPPTSPANEWVSLDGIIFKRG